MRAASHTSTPHSMWHSSLSQTLCLCACICVYMYLYLCVSLSLCYARPAVVAFSHVMTPSTVLPIISANHCF
jgi:hypothetical protein